MKRHDSFEFFHIFAQKHPKMHVFRTDNNCYFISNARNLKNLSEQMARVGLSSECKNNFVGAVVAEK